MRLWLLAAILLPGCARGPEFYAPPARQYQHGFQPGKLKPWIAMNDPLASAHLAEGVSPLEGDRHRWVDSKAVLKFDLRVIHELRLAIDLSATAPTTMSIRINGREFDQARYDQPGERRYEKAVDAGLLQPGENAVTIETEKRLALFTAGFVD